MVASGWYYGQADANDGKYQHFSRRYAHHLAIRTDKKHLRTVESEFQLLHGFYQPPWMRRFPVLSKLIFFAAVIYGFGLTNKRHGDIDVIVARDPLSSGIVGVALSKILRVPLIVELNGNFANPHVWTTSTRKLRRARRWVGLRVARFVIARTSAVKQLYPGQCASLGGDMTNVTEFSFHNYVALAPINYGGTEPGKYLLAMGTPWYIKGIDILVAAYNNVTSNDANYPFGLRIVGWIPDSDMEGLKQSCDLNNSRITFSPPVAYADGQKLLAESAAVVVASRSEAMGRVLIEAMSHGALCIASDVDGIPHFAEHGKTALLFERENVAELTKLLRLVSSDAFHDMRASARESARQRYSGEEFARHYEQMILNVLQSPEH